MSKKKFLELKNHGTSISSRSLELSSLSLSSLTYNIIFVVDDDDDDNDTMIDVLSLKRRGVFILQHILF